MSKNEYSVAFVSTIKNHEKYNFIGAYPKLFEDRNINKAKLINVSKNIFLTPYNGLNR